MVKLLESALNFVKDAYNEFKNVSWPSKEQTIRLTVLIIGVSLGVALFVWLIDLILKELLSTFLIK